MQQLRTQLQCLEQELSDKHSLIGSVEQLIQENTQKQLQVVYAFKQYLLYTNILWYVLINIHNIFW